MTAALAVPAPGIPAPGAATAPAPLRVVVRPAPRREPPFDDELEQLPVVSAWDRRLPFPDPYADAARPVRTSPRPAALPMPGAWARRLLVGLTESAAGRRPLQQLSTMVTFSIARGLTLDFERTAQLGVRHWLHEATVRSVRTTCPADGVAEVSATMSCGPRVRAIALRLECGNGRWRCTRLQLG